MIGGTGHEIYVEGSERRRSTSVTSSCTSANRSATSTRREIVGYQAAYVATAVVEVPGDVSKAVLTEGAREALEGDRLISQEGESSLNFTPHAPTTDIDGQIIAVADGAEQIGQYQVVVLNRGATPRPRRRARCSRSTSRARSCRTSTARSPWGKEAVRRESAAALRARRHADRLQGVRSPELRPGDRRPRTDAGRGSRLQPVTHFSSYQTS